MSQKQTLDKLIESHGIIAVFNNEKKNCLRIIESRNPSLFQIGFVIIGVNGNYFMTLSKAEQLHILQNERILIVETMPFDVWVNTKVDMAKEKKRANDRVENMSPDQIMKKRERNLFKNMTPEQVMRSRERGLKNYKDMSPE